MSIIKLINYDCLILGKEKRVKQNQNPLAMNFMSFKGLPITALRLMTIPVIIILQYHEGLRTKYKVQTMHSPYCASGMFHVCKYYSIFKRLNSIALLKKTADKQLTF